MEGVVDVGVGIVRSLDRNWLLCRTGGVVGTKSDLVRPRQRNHDAVAVRPGGITAKENKLVNFTHKGATTIRLGTDGLVFFNLVQI